MADDGSSDAHALALSVSAQINKLEKAFEKAAGVVDSRSTQMEKRAQRLAAKIDESAGKINVVKALDKVFDESKLRILDEGGAKIQVFGAALEPLGPLGIAAAAGIAGVALAAEQAMRAMEWAHELEGLADRIGITAAELQKLQYAAQQSDVSAESLTGGLQNLNASLGAIQSGVGAKKIETAFAALGISNDQLKDMHDASELVPLLADRISKLSSIGAQTQIARKLGVEELLPLLRKGSDGVRDLTTAASDLGHVIDNETVRSLAEMNKQVDAAHDRIDKQLKLAFVGLAPAIEAVTTTLANLLQLLNQKMPGGDTFGGFLAKTTFNAATGNYGGIARDVAKNARQPAEQWGDMNSLLKGAHEKGLYGDAAMAFAKAHMPEYEAPGTHVTAEDIAETFHIPKPGEKPVHQGGNGKAGPRDDSRQRDDTITNIEAAAQRAKLEALLSLTTDIAARAAIEGQIAAEELTAKKAMIDRNVAAVLADKGLVAAKKDEELARLDIARQAEIEASAIKQAEIIAKALNDQDVKDLDRRKKKVAYGIADLQAQERMADIVAERAKLEHQALDAQKAIDDQERKVALADKQRLADAADLARGDGVKTIVGDDGAQKAADRAYESAGALIDKNNAGPIKQYLAGIQDVDTAMQNAEVGGIQSLNAALADLAVKGGSAKGVLHNLAQQLEIDFAKIALQQLESSALKVLGFDGGGYSGPGVRAAGLDGKGGFMAMLHPNETVIDHTVSPRNVRSSGGVAIVAGPTFNLQGAVVTQDLLNQMNGISQRHKAEAISTSVDISRRAQAGWAGVTNWEHS